jgi:predicted metal-dependent hydrolase
MNYFRIGSILINVEYKKIKALRITVYPPDGRTLISAPLDAADESIRDFAASKIQWVEKHREKFRRNTAAKNQLKNNEIHFVWGTAYSLELIEKNGRPKISLEEKFLRLQIPPGTVKSKKQQILDKWYHRLLVDAAPPLVRKWEKITGLNIKTIFYRKMKTHWGSCNSQRHTIRLNTELAKKNPLCLEYVIVHEILHIIEPSHNQNFYRLMDRYIPDWKTIRRKMNKGEI